MSISQSVLSDQEGYGIRLICEAELQCTSSNACPEAHFNWEFNEKSAGGLSNKLKVRQYTRSVENQSTRIRQHTEVDAPSAFVSKNFGRFACSSVFGSVGLNVSHSPKFNV